MSIAISDGTGSIIVTYSTNKQIKNVELFSFPATEDAAQGDYIAFSNAANQTFAAWLDIDEDGTEPTGIFFGNSVVQIKVPIVAEGTAIENAAAFVAACESDLDWDGLTLTDNEDGTVKITNVSYGANGEALCMNADDSESGSITAETVITGIGTSIIRQDSYSKGQVNIVADTNRNVIVFNSIGTEGSAKGNPSQRFKYEEITAPSSIDVLNLKTQIDAWNVAAGGGTVTGIVTNEAANEAEMTGLNGEFTTNYPFVYHSIEVFFNELKMTLGTDYIENGAAGAVTFASIRPDATLETPDTLTFNYIKL